MWLLTHTIDMADWLPEGVDVSDVEDAEAGCGFLVSRATPGHNDGSVSMRTELD